VHGGLLFVPAGIVALLAVYSRAGPAAAAAAFYCSNAALHTKVILEAWSRRPHVWRARAWNRSVALVLRTCLPACPEVLAVAGVSVSMALSAAIPDRNSLRSPGVGQHVSGMPAMSR